MDIWLAVCTFAVFQLASAFVASVRVFSSFFVVFFDGLEGLAASRTHTHYIAIHFSE